MRKLALAGLGLCLTLGAANTKTGVEVATTQRVDLQANWGVRVSGSLGQLNIEGWDQPAVEITLIRTLYREDAPDKRDKAKQQMERIRVTAEQRGEDIVIGTTFPKRAFWKRLGGKTGVALDYRLRVPRHARLVIRHGSGDILINDSEGDIDASVGTGTIVLQLPVDGSYAIDARCRAGKVNSDFEGVYHHPLWIGQTFAEGSEASTHELRLRTGVGDIDIQKISAPAKQ